MGKPNYDKLETQHIELQLKYQNLEQYFWFCVSSLAGLALYFKFDSFPIAVPVALVIGFVGWYFIADKPFTKDFPGV